MILKSLFFKNQQIPIYDNEKGSKAFLNKVEIEVINNEIENVFELTSNTYKDKKEIANNPNTLVSSFREYKDK